jgi:hypothetical protein
MALERVTLRVTELRCIAQSEGSAGSEPYLWLTFFAFGAQPLPGQTGPVATMTPSYDSFRTGIPDNIKAGQAVTVPAFYATASFDFDLALTTPKFVGCVAVLMEQDDTPDSSIGLGYGAYAKAIDKQLNDLVNKRIQAGDFGPITDAEIKSIKDAVNAKVTEAVGSNQSWWNLFTDQDDNLGVTYKTFTDSEIQSQYFDFPEIVSQDASDRFALSGGLSLGPVPTDPVDHCATLRAAVNAKKAEITSLQLRVATLQNQLQNATPQEKSGIVADIKKDNDLLTQAEAELPALQGALDLCTSHHHLSPVIDPAIVVVNH